MSVVVRSRNTVLVVASLGFLAVTLNWFAMSSYFPNLAFQDHIGASGLSLLVSSFLAGYGILHIPAGMWARRYGLRATVVLGLVVESLASGVEGWVHGVFLLIFLRGVAGGAAALVLGGDLAWVTQAFRHHRLVLALGISASAAYSIGALLGLQWSLVVPNMGSGLALAGALGLVIALTHGRFMNSSDHRGAPARGTWTALGRVMKNRQLLWVGFGAMGGYGAYFTLTQAGPMAMVSSSHLSLHFTQLLASILVALGIPGSLLGGYGANRPLAKKWFILLPSLVIALSLLMLPHTPDFLRAGLFALVGFAVMVARPAYMAFPGHADPPIAISDLATAEGFIFTILALGGAVFPLLFAEARQAWGMVGAFHTLGILTVATTLLGLPLKTAIRTRKRGHPSAFTGDELVLSRIDP